MDSASNRILQEVCRKEELEKKISKLQAELSSISQSQTIPEGSKTVHSPKRKKQPEAAVLAPATPSPRKKRKLEAIPTGEPIARNLFQSASKLNASKSRPRASGSKSDTTLQQPKPSNLLEKLAKVHAAPAVSRPEFVARSTSFADRSEPPPAPSREEDTVKAAKRDENLMLIDEFEPGPYQFEAPSDDPLFEKLEPHSNVALTSRSIPHEDFSDHLRGRYYLSPSHLYSSVRLQPDKQGYDIPVPGDWVTIAVVAERGPVRMTKAPVTLGPDEGALDPKNKWKKKKAEESAARKPHGKHFTSMKLVDFGAKSRSSATGGKAVVRGDAFLSLLLFEADAVETITSNDGNRLEKVYRGGSRGAYEMFDKLKPGDVIALLNPKILKPYQRSADKPHPVDNILAVTPESASSIAILGKARDLGRCGVKKRDGNACGGWCDKRVSEVCDYHVQTAVQHRRAARPEFTAGTGGMTSKPTAKRKHEYDPARQWGLKPEPRQGDDATYIVSGHIVSGSSSKSMFVGETLGREGQAKAQRKMANAESEKVLKQLLARDKEGMEYVIKARELLPQKNSGSGKGKGKALEELSSSETSTVPRKMYSGSIIRSLGFDPTVKAGHRRVESNSGKGSKYEALQALSATRTMALGRVPKRPTPTEVKPVTKGKSPVVEDEELGEEDRSIVDLDDF